MIKLATAFSALFLLNLGDVGADCGMIVVLPGMPHGSCIGCIPRPEPMPSNDQALHCPNGQLGATIVTSGSEFTSGGACESSPRVGDDSCIFSGRCGWQMTIEVLFTQNSCFATMSSPGVWVEGPGITGRNPLSNTWTCGTLSQSSDCSDKGETFSGGTSFDVYDQQANGNLIGRYGFKVVCSQCKRR